MSSGQFEAQAAHAPLPGPGTKTAFTTSSGDIDLTAHKGKWIILIATAKAHIRAGATSQTATTSDVWLPPDFPQQFKVTDKRLHLGVIAPAGGGGDIHYAIVDED